MPDSRLFQYNQSPSQSKGSRYTEISTAFYAFFCRFYIVVRIAVSLITKKLRYRMYSASSSVNYHVAKDNVVVHR